MRRTILTALALSVPLLAACDNDAGQREATEQVEVHAYNPDTLAWVQEGRTVRYDNRNWIMSGSPVYHPTVREVGEFEGMKLYAPADETVPYADLLFPVGDGEWQMLAPAPPLSGTRGDTAGSGAADTTGAGGQ